MTVPYSYSPPHSCPIRRDLRRHDHVRAAGVLALAGYGYVAETYRQVSVHQYLAGGKTNPNYIGTRIGRCEQRQLRLRPWRPWTVSSSARPDASGHRNVLLPATGAAQGTPIFNANAFVNAVPARHPAGQAGDLQSPGDPGRDATAVSISAATAICERKRAFLIMDPAAGDSADGSVPGWPTMIEDTMEGNTPGEEILTSQNSALYFPYLTTNDPLTGRPINPLTNHALRDAPQRDHRRHLCEYRPELAASGRPRPGWRRRSSNVNDVVERGQMTDQRQGVLNPLGIELRARLPGHRSGRLGRPDVDLPQNTAFQQWKYVPVRRMALFLEQTLYANLGWVVFEPNADAALDVDRHDHRGVHARAVPPGGVPGDDAEPGLPGEV